MYQNIIEKEIIISYQWAKEFQWDFLEKYG